MLVYFINSEDAKNEPIGSALSQLLGTNVEELNNQISDFVSQIPGTNLDLSGPQEIFWNEGMFYTTARKLLSDIFSVSKAHTHKQKENQLCIAIVFRKMFEMGFVQYLRILNSL